MTRHNFFLPIPLVDKLRKLSESKGVTMSELLRQALAEYLEKK